MDDTFDLHEVRADLAPHGHLRASINLGNPILAGRSVSGELQGVSVDLVRRLASLLGLGVELKPYDAAVKAVDAMRSGEVDIGFFAIDPQRSQGICFTPPYVLIEGAYLVRADSPLNRGDEVDAKDNQVVVGAGSAYDLFLTRALQRATIVRSPTSPGVVDMFMTGKYQVAAGVKQQLQSDQLRHAGTRLLPESFMVIRQAMGAPERIGLNTRQFLTQFIKRAKADGSITQLLKLHGIVGADVAPASET